MRKIFSGALALALLASTGVAAAQEARDYNPQVRRSWRNDPDAAREAPRPPEAPRAQAAPAAPQANDWDGRDGRRWQGGGGRRGDSDGWDRNRGGDRDGPQDRDSRQDRDGRRDWDARRDGRDGRQWRDEDRREWRDGRRWDDPRRHQPRPSYDRRRYDPVWRGHQRHWGWAYVPPPGFYMRHWSYGDTLPRSWWTPQYRILDWWAYGLPIPPAGYEWIRVGDDALLVDMFSGRVVQVAYRLFW